MKYYAEVILPYRFGGGTFTYSSEASLEAGVRVRVTLRRKELIGVVSSVSLNKPPYKVLPVLEVIDDDPIMLPGQLKLVTFASDYYADSIGNVFKSILPPRIRGEAFSGMTISAYHLIADNMEDVLNGMEKRPAQYRTLLIFADTEKDTISRQELLKRGASERALKILSDQHILEKTEVLRDNYSPLETDYSLNIDIEDILPVLDKKPLVEFGMSLEEQVSLIEKISCYFVSQKKCVLVMLPAENTTLLEALGNGSDDVITYFASESPAQRTNSYLRLLNSPESVRLVIGGRISAFLPFKNIGHIFLIDEHDERYRGMRSPVFNARDMAVMIARDFDIGLTLFSSSPSLEAMTNVENGLFRIENHDVDYPVKVLEKGSDLLSRYSREKMAEVLSSGKNVLVFQNRRGYAGHVECVSCGNIPSCPRCNAHLGFHASSRVLKCHYCGYVTPYDGKCQVCGHDISVTQGYGTERMASTLSSLFDGYKISILDSDQKDRFESDARIIVGTSYMIRHISSLQNIGLVLVANADNLLCSTDFRATEKAFRTIMTLRTIAKENGAEYIVQTKDFRQPVFKCLEDGSYMNFYNIESEERKGMNFPPYLRMMRLEFRHHDTVYLHDAVEKLYYQLVSSVSGPIFSPVFDPDVDRIDMEYITEIVVRFQRTKQALASKKQVLDILDKLSSNVLFKIKIKVEVDPQ